MRDDLRSVRTAFPSLLPGAMFILPFAVACNAVAGTTPAHSAPAAQAAAKPASAPPKPTSPSPRLGGQPASAPPSLPSPPISASGAAGKEVFNVQFQETEIAQALQMLSIQGQRNIITGKNVAGSVTANLFDVTVTEALDVILKALDLRYEEVGNFIYVYTREEWEQMQLARRKRESRRFTLEYISGKDANEFVMPLLSDTGKVAMLGSVDKGVTPDTSNVGEDSWAFQAMLVVNDYPENLQAIAELLTEVDTPPSQVSVDATIVSTRVTENNAFGVDFSVIANVNFTDFVNPLGVVNNLISGNNTPGDKGTDKLGFQPLDNSALGVNSSVGQAQRPGGLKVGVISDNVSVFLRVLDEVTDAVILARPRVMALNRQRAHILVGEKVGYISTTSTETTTTQTVQYLDTGIKLIFRPFISRDGSIRMELAPSVSEAVLRQVTSDGGGGVVIPDEKTNQVTTNIRVKDGQTMVIGGLFQEKTTIGRRQVPGLGDIPIVGAAFKGQDDEMIRNEIIFLITPTIMKDAIAAAWGKEGLEFAEGVRVGTREGLLPFSRDRLSASHNQKALDALAVGDTELALHHTDSSLRLNHIQPEMIRLRSELDSTQPSHVFERDMMKRIMEQRTASQAAAASAGAPLIPASDPLAQTVQAQAQSATPAEPATEMPTQTANATEEPNAEDAMTSPESFDDGDNAPAAPGPDENCDDQMSPGTPNESTEPARETASRVDETISSSTVVFGAEGTAPEIEFAEASSLFNQSPYESPLTAQAEVTSEPALSPDPATVASAAPQQSPKFFIEIVATNSFLKPWMALLQRGLPPEGKNAYATVIDDAKPTNDQ